MNERYPDNERRRPQGTTYPAPLLRGFICMAALPRDRKPQEDDSDENQQGLKDEVHFTNQKPDEHSECACEHCELSNRHRDRIQGERKDQIGLGVVDLPKAGGRGQAKVQGRRPFV
ncbi:MULTISPECIES: hypothetical protein [unclassified Bradyrhizobium]|uniref:hypothetical protein n=1 Tax=unclassified Bradyrhizobium TaxID=2631580 RepID=UPI001FFA2B8E|nr:MULTISPECIES: hypothetical protein [unclassified Bradyrhizobium]MCK1709114.1 hypothetical protein [Bradyrhizobium sp. 143]MCK1726408.1 hypothetical protein [Bradyrhizobium sp. 142]